MTDALEAAQDVLDQDLPKAVVHGGFASNNIFAADNRVTAVFDWETAQYGPRVLDLAFSWVSAPFDGSLDPANARDALLDGYDATVSRPLTGAEHRALPQAVTFVAAAAAASFYVRGYGEHGPSFPDAAARYRA